MSGISWTTVEDAVVAALQERLGSQVKTVRSYQGNWRTDLRQESWRLPAALVMLTGGDAEQVGWSSFDLTLNLQVLVVVRHLRGEEAGRRETGGAYDLLLGAQEALWHQDLGLNLLPWVLVREEPLLTDGEFTVYGAQYRTTAVQDR
ncbi:MAG: phage protein Gp37 [Desulfobaccales bacterium]